MGGYFTLDLQMCGCTGIVTSPVDYTERVIVGPRKLSTCTDRHIHEYQRRSLRHGENDAAAPASEFLTCDWHTHPEFSVRQDKRRSMSRDASLDGICDAAGSGGGWI
ncbi:hypothetical protein BOTNAR_0143g00110 [Botryotinia narcissicola]|uniref:Uncharacterized protein n=1 Tax=Botryotinia narcissicola TaxID=278944 RepID=A0A4Z1IFZ5_9HELO|nr:hypothetical protein BOTNAR_0143g00110 [Botryotinia narcissicola]